MNPMLSARLQAVKPSATLAITARVGVLRAAGHDVIGLGGGEPDFDTPEHIKAAAIAAIQAGKTKYTAVDGTVELKQAIVDKFARDNQLDYTLKQVLVSCGGKQSFYNLAQAILGAGDEVIIPAPYWVSYPDMVLLADAKPVIVPTLASQDFKLTAAQLAAAITPKTRLLVLNSPSNPTGMMYTAAELSALGAVIRQHPHVMLATDDMYEHVVWQAGSMQNIVQVCPDLYERTLVLNGVSKAYSMTGWRIGYAAGPEMIIQAMKKVQSQSTSNPASISQAAAEAALSGPQDCIGEMVAAFKQRHDYVVERLSALPGVECKPTDGTFYVFPSLAGLIKRLPGIQDDVQLVEHLIERAGIAGVPGTAFGQPDYVRFSVATSQENLHKGMDRLEAYVKAHG